jgi:hypothetical protein
MRQHADGTPCKEGTRDTPPGFAPCCDLFRAHLETCEFDIRYEWWPTQRFWVIAIAASAGGGGAWIAHCPHCGALLQPASQRPPEEEDNTGQPGRWLQV